MSRHHGVIDKGNPECLHCVLKYAMGKWAERNAPRDAEGVIVLNVAEALCKIAELVGGLVYVAPAGSQRVSFERYAHKCLEASFEHQRTGKVVGVSIDPSARGH